MAIVSTTSGDWSSGGTWVGGVAPAAGEDATISAAHVVKIDGDRTIVNLIVNGTLVPKNNADCTLTVNGTVTGTGTIAANNEMTATGTTPFPSAYRFALLLNAATSGANGPTVLFDSYVPAAATLRLIPAAGTGSRQTITSITRGTTTTVSCTNHGFAANANVVLMNLGTMTELEGMRVKINTVVDANTVTLKWYDTSLPIDSTAFGAYSGGAGMLCAETAAAANATTLYYLGTDISADPEWTRFAVARVNVDNVNRAQASHQQTLSACTSSTLTINALGAAKLTGSLICLVTRNVAVNSGTTAVTTALIKGGTGHRLNCEVRPGWATINTPITVGVSITGAITSTNGVFSGNSYGSNSGTGHLFTTCTFSGNTSGSNGGTGHLFTTCTFSGNNAGSTGGTGHLFTTCVFSGNNYCSNGGTGHLFTTCVFSGNANSSYAGVIDLYGGTVLSASQLVGGLITGHGCEFTTFTSYNQASNGLGGNQQAISYDNAGIVGDIKAWMSGGTIVPDTATIPAGSNPSLTATNKFSFAAPAANGTTGNVAYPGGSNITPNNSYPVFYDTQILVPAGKYVEARIQVKADVSGSWYEIPRIQMIDPNQGMFSAASVLSETVMTDDTNWQTIRVVYKSDTSRNLKIRIRGCATSGNLWTSKLRTTIGNRMYIGVNFMLP